MMRYDFHVHKDYHGIKAEDKEKVYDLICEGPKTTREIASITGRDGKEVRNIVYALTSIGVVESIGRAPGGRKVWRCKA